MKPLLEKYNVDVYACGHDHNCQLLFENGVSYIVSGGTNYYERVVSIPSNFFTSMKEGLMAILVSQDKLSIEYCDCHLNRYEVYSHMKIKKNEIKAV